MQGSSSFNEASQLRSLQAAASASVPPKVAGKTRASQIAGQDIYFNMQVDTQFPNIFREKGIKQPFTMFNIKTIVDAKANQLVQTLLEKLANVEKRDPEVARLGITEKNISLYFHCHKGDRWWFENTQRIADIVDSGHWSVESIL